MSESEQQARRAALVEELLDPNVPKTEREHALVDEIKELLSIARIAGRMRLTDWLNAGGNLALFDYAERLAEEMERRP